MLNAVVSIPFAGWRITQRPPLNGARQTFSNGFKNDQFPCCCSIRQKADESISREIATVFADWQTPRDDKNQGMFREIFDL